MDPSLEIVWDMPVIGVTWFEAIAYAEWAGKSLPTWCEWESIASGDHGYMYPWGDDDPQRIDGIIAGHSFSKPEFPWAGYMKYVKNVNSDPGDDIAIQNQTKFMFGNVAEWTESVFVAPTGAHGRPIVDPLRVLVMGYGWNSQLPLKARVNDFGVEEPSLRIYGFRCVKRIYK